MEKSGKILIVDDEKEFLIMLREALELRGFEVITVENAVEAGLELATKIPSLMLMDIRMPGIDGMQACKVIKRNPATKDIPIIIVSALPKDVYATKACKLGITDHFDKPIDMDKLIARIKEIVE